MWGVLPLEVGIQTVLAEVKKVFIATFAKGFKLAFVKTNIQLSFTATGLVPNDLLAVLSKLEVKPRTPTPPLPGTTQWSPKISSNAAEIENHSTLLRDRIERHQSSSPYFSGVFWR